MPEPVSVIIPTYNRRNFLPSAIASVLIQDHPFELIVVDDGSDDGTESVVPGDDPRIRYIRQPNRGAAASRNTGIQAARHDLIAFLDSDDRFVAGKLELQAAAMGGAPRCLVSHTEELWYRRGVLLNQKKRHIKEEGDLFARSLELCVVGMSTIMARRRLFEVVGLFDESLPCCEDYDLWLRVGCRFPFLLVREALTIKEGGRADQLSVRYRVGMDRYRIASIRALLDSGYLSEEQGHLARAELFRKCNIYGAGCLKHGRPEEGRAYLDLARRLADSGRKDRGLFGWETGSGRMVG
ncbi:MAG: glycosyltransferase family A protein [Deltaproteobacteria bacterium]